MCDPYDLRGLSVPQRIDLLMGIYGWNDADLAKRIGITKQTLQNYRKDPDRMPYKVIRKICETFKCSAALLLDGADKEVVYREAIEMVRDVFGTKTVTEVKVVKAEKEVKQ